MKPSRPIIVCLLLLVAAVRAHVATAQNYAFRVPNLKLQCYVNPDASVRFVYDISFQNEPYGHPIDIVDIGLPHDEAEPRDMHGMIAGSMLRDVRPSTYVANAVEVHLHSDAIASGRFGTVRFEFTMPDMVFQDTTREDYASLQLTPTWFDDDLTHGTTHLQIAVHLPESIKPEEVLHQGEPFTQQATYENHQVVVWDYASTRATGPHLVAVSFPKRDLDRVVEMTRLGLLLRWFRASTQARLIAAIIFAVVYIIMFIRFSGATGWSLLFISLCGLGFLFFISPNLHLLAFIPLVLLFALNEWHLARRDPTTTYLPAIAQIEGGGIKRGLTAPEAAVILELPLTKVLTLVIFGLLKKKILQQTNPDPLTVKWSSQIPAPMADWGSNRRKSHLRTAAKRLGTVVHEYEFPFLDLIHNNPDRPLNELDFSTSLEKLIKHAAGRLRNFDTSDTQDYYRSIIRRAIKEADSIGDVTVREKVLDSAFDWVLMDDDYPTVFSRGGHVYRPPWTRTHSAPTPSVPSAPDAGARGAPSFGDVSASFAGWTENTMGSLASAFDPQQMSFPAARGGVLDLSGADRVTADFFEALSEASASGGSGGGGGCACAGCACACACAGGGR